MGCCVSKDDGTVKGEFTDLHEEAQKKQKGGTTEAGKQEDKVIEAKPKQPVKEDAKLGRYETDGSTAPPPPAPIAEEPPAPEPAQPKLKARSNIVEAKSSKPNPKPAPAKPVEEDPKPAPEAITPEATSGKADAEAAKPAEPPAKAGSALAALLMPPDGASMEEEQEFTRKAKESLQHEVSGPKSMFGGAEEKEEKPEKVSTAERVPFMEEEVADFNNSFSADAATPQKAETSMPSAADNFPSAQWFADNGLECIPALYWWQERKRVTIEIKLDDPKSLNICVKEPNTFLFSCTSNDKPYRLHLALREAVNGQDVETRLEKGNIIIGIPKKEEKLWTVLLEADRRQYMGLDWIHYDMAKSEDSDSESDEESEED